MSSFLTQIPAELKDHIRGITKTSGLPDGDESVEAMAEAWLGKKEAFEREIELQDMEEIDTLEKHDTRGAVAMTYSGSLVNIGPLNDDYRKVEYSSIGLRSDVPDTAKHDAATLGHDVEVNGEVVFEEGPVSRTSAVYKIAACRDELSVEDQEEALANVTMVLTQEFADINKTLVLE